MYLKFDVNGLRFILWHATFSSKMVSKNARNVYNCDDLCVGKSPFPADQHTEPFPTDHHTKLCLANHHTKLCPTDHHINFSPRINTLNLSQRIVRLNFSQCIITRNFFLQIIAYDAVNLSNEQFPFSLLFLALTFLRSSGELLYSVAYWTH